MDNRIELAKKLFREYHTQCFWHCPHDTKIDEDDIPFIIKGLRMYGGHRGFLSTILLKEVDGGK